MSESIQHIEDLIHHGRFLEARARTDEALRESDNIRLRQLYALALSKSGVPEAARDYLEPFYKSNPEDPESAGILGSIYKELFKKNQQTSFALQSRDTYLKNFAATRNYYTGINAASMSAMVMQTSKSKEIATSIIQLIRPDTEDFWELATLGEAYLLLKDKAKSVEYYIKARRAAATDWGKITSAYNQLWLLNHFMPVSSEVMKIFNPPGVVAFAGHMLDHPQRMSPRFPAEIESKVKDALVNSIRNLNARIGYSSIACGGDILFAEAMAEEGGELNLFLPFAIPDFLDISVRFAGEQWVDRFNKLLERFPVTLITHEKYLGHDDLFSFQSKVIFGSAVLRSAMHHAEPSLLTVQSEVDLKRSEGGTRDTLRLWPFPQRQMNINPDIFVVSERSVDQPVKRKEPEPKSVDRPVLYLVLAEFAGLNSMEREKILKVVNTTIEDEATIYSAVEKSEDSVLIAFEVEMPAIDMVRKMQESVKRMAGESKLKITLHAGPVYRKGNSIEGENVNTIYEISKFAPRDVISASGNIAALLALDPKKFAVEYAGLFSEGNSKHSVYKIGLKS